MKHIKSVTRAWQALSVLVVLALFATASRDAEATDFVRVRVATAADVPEGSAAVVEVGGIAIALFHRPEGWFAIENTCTHRGGPLGEGALSADTVECPWHGAHFNVKTGAVTSPPAPTGVRSFPVKVERNDVLVEID